MCKVVDLTTVMLFLLPSITRIDDGIFQTIYFFYSGYFLLVMISCKRTDNDVIPDVYVDFTIDLLDPEFVNLSQ